MSALKKIDLSGTWSFTPEKGEKTVIQVPGGGWLKQGFDCEMGTYERKIKIPKEAKSNVTRLELGGVHHFAEYYISEDGVDYRKIAENVTSFTQQITDLTGYVEAGHEYYLRIKVRSHLNGQAVAPCNFEDWPIVRGIFRSSELCVYPSINIKDVYIKTDTETNSFKYEITIENITNTTQKIKLKQALSAWNECDWEYPVLPEEEIEIPAHSIQTYTLGEYDWKLGNASYWWPNIPYVAGYCANLHILHISLSTGDDYNLRFGFRTIKQCGNVYKLNGVRINTRGDSPQVANYEKVNYGGYGDAIDTLPGFLPPSESNPGWPKAVDNFLRLNISSNRAHRQPWSPYMLNVCDEMGMMIISEGASGWNERDRKYHEMKVLTDQVLRDRNHPCIIRWCVHNEPLCMNPEYLKELYDAVKVADDTRPVCIGHTRWEWEKYDPEKAYALIKGNDDFTWMDQHLSYNEKGEARYTAVYHTNAVIPMEKRPYGVSGGLWPHCSTQAGFVQYATMAALLRAEGAREARPFVIFSSWAGIIPGIKHDDLLIEELRYPIYGEDNLPDPWSHPGIQLIQKAFHPLLAMDKDFWRINEYGNGAGMFPVVLPKINAGEKITRNITVFNDELHGSHLRLKWELRAESSYNLESESGKIDLNIEPGEKTVVPVTFTAPEINCSVFLTLHVEKDDQERFEDRMTCFEVVNGRPYGYWGYATNVITPPEWQKREL